jgi:dolichyl-phosphate-mannose--protein O-mannosyl transferase|uniref:MIR domain-containing protein n=1 Tax=Panagrolaimus sp. PS1159 TaxID=55785 RepID=A0AC35FXK1_9BILA
MRVEALCIFAFVVFVFADDDPVTCGSAVKLINAQSKVRLHSHDVKYGSGSGQQSITGRDESDDVNSHWQILGANKDKCSRGTPVKCGDNIRLLHVTTKCLLHSHDFPGPLTKNYQEVSCFGKDGEGDTGDNWKVICSNEIWTEDEEVKLKHVDTGKYLSISGQKFGRPISGQYEIVGVSSPSYSAVWRVAEGIFMQKKDDSF